MKFGSWTFNGDQVELGWYEGQNKVDLSDYVNSGTWDIIDCPGTSKHEYDAVEMHNTAQITFKLRIRRKTLFYTVNLIIPCVLISFLSVCVFYLPADAGEKMTMCISILLALVVFLLLVSKILPPTSITIPLIAKYLLFTFIMNIFTILITVVIINWNFRTPRTHRMPKWVRVVFLNYLPRILFMKRPNHNDRWAKKTYSRHNPSGNHSRELPNSDLRQFAVNARSDLLELSEMHHPNCTLNRKQEVPSGRQEADSSQEANFHMTPETHKAIEAVRFIAAHLKNEDDYAEVSDVIMGVMASQITNLTNVYSTVHSGADHRKHQRRHWPLCREFTGNRRIPRTNGQWRGNGFHLMTSSWNVVLPPRHEAVANLSANGSTAFIWKLCCHWLKGLHMAPGGRLNKKNGLTRYGDSHVKDKTS